MSYAVPYDLPAYAGMEELGGVAVEPDRVVAFGAVKGVPPFARAAIAQKVAAFAGTLGGDKEVLHMDTSGADMRLRWAYRDPIAYDEAVIAHLQGEAAAFVQYVRWGGT